MWNPSNLKTQIEILKLKKDTLWAFLIVDKENGNWQRYRDAMRQILQLERDILANQEILALLSQD